MDHLKYGTIVRLNQPEHLKGMTGKVVGRATEYQPVIGASYILKSAENSTFYSQEYRYEYITAFECMFDVVYVPKFNPSLSRMAVGSNE